MAQIIEESGLSAGSVYSHFATKHEIIELVAAQVISERADRLSTETEEHPLSPLQIVHWWLPGLGHDALPYGAALQIWGEAASDPSLRTIVEDRMAAIEDAFAAVELLAPSTARRSSSPSSRTAPAPASG